MGCSTSLGEVDTTGTLNASVELSLFLPVLEAEATEKNKRIFFIGHDL